LVATICGSRSANSGEDLGAEELDRLHDVLVAVLAGLQHEDDLVDAGLLVARRYSRTWSGVPTAPADPRVAGGDLGAERLTAFGDGRFGGVTPSCRALDELVPHVGLAGTCSPNT
jgi:hypothetical protein